MPKSLSLDLRQRMVDAYKNGEGTLQTVADRFKASRSSLWRLLRQDHVECDVAYGKRGRISASDLQAQRNTCSCLTLIIACIIYWQAKEITHIIGVASRNGKNRTLRGDRQENCQVEV